MGSRAACVVYRVPGLLDYRKGWRYQKALTTFLNTQRKAENTDIYHRMILAQHPSVYTLGRGSTLDNLKFDPLAAASTAIPEVVRVERGGEVTWHGPGQLVAYPIFDLTREPLKKDLHWFMNSLEQTVVDTLGGMGVSSGRSDVNNGVWVGTNKIAAVGVTASRWVTMHGLALNVTPEMASYEHIVPCGIREPGYGVTSLRRELGTRFAEQGEHSMDAVGDALVASFGEVFGMDIHFSPDPALELDIIECANPTSDKLPPIERT